MVYRQATPRGRKFIVLASVIALHAGLIAWLIHQKAVIEPRVREASIAMIAIDAERPAAAKPPPPSLPAKVADTFVPVTELSIPAESESEGAAGASSVCSTLDIVREALLLDTVAIEAIRNAPPETRSVADAIVLWNVGWAPAAQTEQNPLFVVRAAIERRLSDVPEECLDETVAGPRLVPIPDASGLQTTFVVFGSGVWTWRALLASLPPTPAKPSGSAPAPVLPSLR